MENGTQQPPPTVVRMSPTIGQLVAALAKAQRKLQNPERNRTVQVRTKQGGTYEFAYATLDAILDHARPILAENEIALLQGVQSVQGAIAISSLLGHVSGEWVESVVRFPSPTGPQEIGSLITYGRRYTLTGLLGIAAEEDDDANSAAGNAATTKRQEAPGDTRVERDPIPAGIPAWQGKLVRMTSKGFKKKDGSDGTRWTFHGADGESFNTFSGSIARLVKESGKDAEFQIVYSESKYGKDIEEIKPLQAEPPYSDDGEPPF